MKYFIYFFVIFSSFAFGKNSDDLRRFNDLSFEKSGFKSESGQDIFLWKSEDKPKKDKFRVYLQSGLHGNEELPPEFSFWLTERIRNGEGELSRLMRHIRLDVIAVANPDGRAKKSRFNANNVDLNRNFPILWGRLSTPSMQKPGTAPLSEAETKAISKIIKNGSYDLAIDLHGYDDKMYFPSSSEIISLRHSIHGFDKSLNYNNFIKTSRGWAESISHERAFPHEMGHGGSFEDWAFWEMGVWALCVEFDQKDLKNFKSDKEKIFEKYERLLVRIISESMEEKSGFEW